MIYKSYEKSSNCAKKKKRNQRLKYALESTVNYKPLAMREWAWHKCNSSQRLIVVNLLVECLLD